MEESHNLMHENEFREKASENNAKRATNECRAFVPLNNDILRKHWNLLAFAGNARSEKKENTTKI